MKGDLNCNAVRLFKGIAGNGATSLKNFPLI